MRRTALLPVLLLPLLATLGCVQAWRSSLPQVEGEVLVEGLDGPVQILRDEWGVPHIQATTDHDALYALGYVHAQDRLWQMELNRRIGAGRLSEVFGKRTIETDTYLRTIGFRARAEDAIANMPDEWRWLFDSYCAGVNQYLSEGHELPPEFKLLRFTPEPWTPVDGYTWVKLMSQDLGADAHQEELRVALERQMDPALVAELLGPFPAEAGRVIMPDPPFPPTPEPAAGTEETENEIESETDDETENETEIEPGSEPEKTGALGPLPAGGPPAFLRELMGYGNPGKGSNNWVVGASNTETGLPILCNDPHLGYQMPALWYLAHVHGEDIHVAGATFPGLPMVVIGHNERLAWGLTNVNPDVQDLVLERFDPDDPHKVEYMGQFEPVTVRNEVIEVKGGEPVTVEVRETRHGPIVTRFFPGVGEEVALRWTALQDTDDTAVAYAELTLADSVEEGQRAMRHYVAPAQNIVMADVDGHIGWVAMGRIPIRPAGDDGNHPVPGWDGQHEWLGYVPHEENPRSYDPPQDWIVTANNRPAPPDYPYYLGDDWSAPYRAERIIELLEPTFPATLDEMATIQGDQRSLYAVDLMPALLAAAQDEPDLLLQLQRWDGTMREDSAGAAIFQAWANRLPQALMADELGEVGEEVHGLKSSMVYRCYVQEQCSFCDDVTTAGTTEDCAHAAEVALDMAVEMLRDELGDDPATWRWGDAHHTEFDHTLGSVKALAPIFNREIRAGGGPFTVNVSWYDMKRPFVAVHGPSYRQILDVSDWDRSRFVHTTGQSGHPSSRHFDDLIPEWKANRLIPMPFSDEAVEAAAVERMVLQPR